ncbi:YeeE/YedE thiosulfate transporter family protein [Actinopolyspora sp. H202]|uniref:YeeE/YedE thiosulfate transporter family protein n=1 Tax=Actinopolyspora sp. H202 TaxID=1500456 RepID=UPI003EE6DB9B
MILAVVTGLVSGVLFGYVLQRGRLCFHAIFAGMYERRFALARAWLLAVALTSVGLTALYATPAGRGLSTGLPLNPVGNVLGGLVFGVGMAVAASCVSGLFFKLGSGMLGALVGLGGWVCGELAASGVRLPGSTVLPGGVEGTLPGVLGVPRAVVAVPFAVLVVVLGWRWRGDDHRQYAWQWRWPFAGVALAVVAVASWLLAGLGGASFGASTVGAVSGIATGNVNWWLVAFLCGIVLGGFLAARTAGGWWLRGETRVRYLRLLFGGFLLGFGALLAGGCNLGHGLSGAAQLNVSSWLVVAAFVVGIGLTRKTQRVLSAPPVPSERTY